jgi:hypothetical protein
MPVDVLGGEFSEALGRPTKELYSMAGLVFIMPFHDWTVEQAAHTYLFETSVPYALNLEPARQSLCERSLERYLARFRKKAIAEVVMDRVTATLLGLLELNLRQQRLDSTHVFSAMALFGRTQLMGGATKRFLTQVRRHDPEGYAALPETLRTRDTLSSSSAARRGTPTQNIRP